MSDTEFVTAISLLISTALLIVIWRFMAGLHSDDLRDRLFALRDRMFLYALDQGIVATPAYENLRLLMNQLIRYAHRVSLGRLLLLALSARIFGLRPGILASYAKWEKALDALPAAQRQHMREFHEAAMTMMMKHMIVGSPFLWAASCVVVANVLVFKSARFLTDAIVSSIRQRIPSMNLIEADALRSA